MTYTPEHLQNWADHNPSGWDSQANYGGDDFSDYYVSVGRTRDSDLLTESNFRIISKELLAFDTEAAPVIDAHFGHWACGWYDSILIHKDNEEALRAADEWACALADYPVADEGDFSDLEWETACEYWERSSVSDRVEMLQHCRMNIFAARRDDLPDDGSGGFYQYLLGY